mmetsp:Transcript_685/g.1259  ORF Transcript_685/g.1259 Transcript_685/m.1259 type:complete len:211 (-) Transcript_685:424-1056(-)
MIPTVTLVENLVVDRRWREAMAIKRSKSFWQKNNKSRSSIWIRRSLRSRKEHGLCRMDIPFIPMGLRANTGGGAIRRYTIPTTRVSPIQIPTMECSCSRTVAIVGAAAGAVAGTATRRIHPRNPNAILLCTEAIPTTTTMSTTPPRSYKPILPCTSRDNAIPPSAPPQTTKTTTSTTRAGTLATPVMEVERRAVAIPRTTILAWRVRRVG